MRKKSAKSDHQLHCEAINADRERARFLACSIFPGEGFLPSENTDVAGMLFELLTLIAKYDNPDDREHLIFGIGEAIYPTTFEGQAVIDAYIARRASPKAAKKGGVR
jgi:hypothetical protein